MRAVAKNVFYFAVLVLTAPIVGLLIAIVFKPELAILMQTPFGIFGVILIVGIGVLPTALTAPFLLAARTRARPLVTLLGTVIIAVAATAAWVGVLTSNYFPNDAALWMMAWTMAVAAISALLCAMPFVLTQMSRRRSHLQSADLPF